MKKSNVLNAIATFYAVCGAISMCMVDQHMGIMVFTGIAFAGAMLFSNAADSAEAKHRDQLMLELYEEASTRDEN